MSEIFIGREDILDRLRRDVFFVQPGGKSFCYSLIGLNGIGKTTLIGKLAEEFKARKPENTFYFATEITQGVSFSLFWTKMILRFSKVITEEVLLKAAETVECDFTEEILEAYDFFKENKAYTDTSEFRSQSSIYLSEIFSQFSEMGIRIVITIDEFDRAQKNFEDGLFFQYLFGLTPKGAKRNLSIVTISRRRVSTIAHHMQEGSNFEDGFRPLVLNGFDDAELQTYFDTYRELPCGALSDEAKTEILYLCGRSPGLLMGLRHEFELMSEATQDIGKIYAEHGQFIKVAYDRMITVMESAYADRARQKPLIDIFVQKFIGPAYEEDFESLQALLYDYGFVTKGTVESNIFSLAGVQKEYPENISGSTPVDEPIAPYFVEYIKHRVVVQHLQSLAGMLVKAEKLVREVIEKEMKAAFPLNWETLVNDYAQRKDYYLDTLKLKALQNDFTAGSISKLNVISFKEYFYIIRDHWNLFAQYFTQYASMAMLAKDMSKLSESRNDSAHLNLGIYNGENRRELNDTCARLIACLTKTPDQTAAPAQTTAPAAQTTEAGEPSEEEIERLVNEAPVITFCCQAIKKPKRNLRGIIKENGYPAGIAQGRLADFNLPAPAKVGDEIPAVVVRWDANAKVFNLKAPGAES